MKLIKDNIPFTMVANEILKDPNLSFKAKGLYAYLFSKPDTWDFSSNRMVMETKDGRKAIMSMLKELEESGYLQRLKLPTGKMEYILKHSLSTKTELRVEEPKSQNGTVPKRLSAKSSPISNIYNTSNKEEKVINNNFSDEKFTSSHNPVIQPLVTNTNSSVLLQTSKEERINIDDEGNERPTRVKRKVSQGKNEVAYAYKALCKKSIGEEPVINIKTYSAIKYAKEKFNFTDKDIIGVLEDWVWRTNIGPDEKLNINMALSFSNINKYKLSYQI